MRGDKSPLDDSSVDDAANSAAPFASAPVSNTGVVGGRSPRALRPSPALGALLDHERAASELLAAAEREAQTTIEEGTARADASRARLEEKTTLAIRELQHKHHKQQQREIENKESELHGAIRRIESLDDAAVSALVEHVLALAVEAEDVR